MSTSNNFMNEKYRAMSASTSLNVDHRHSRSMRMAVLQTLVKPFRPRLIAPPKRKETPEGSPELKPPPSIEAKVSIKAEKVCDVWTYEFSARLPTGIKYRPKHDLYYFAGGSFVQTPSSEHWKLCAELASQLPEYRIVIVSHPLAPRYRAAVALPILQELALHLIKKADRANRNITFAGDSSGGNIAMSLALFVTDHAVQEHERRTPLRNVLLISPAMDLRNINAEISEVHKRDPVMTEQHIKWVAQQWIGEGINADDQRVSPVLADLTAIRKLGVRVHGVIGTNDVLAPDAIVFRHRLEEFGVSGEWLEWEKQMHCFPLAWIYPLPESKEAKEWILEALRNNA